MTKGSQILLNSRMYLLRSRGFTYDQSERDAAGILCRLFQEVAKQEERDDDAASRLAPPEAKSEQKTHYGNSDCGLCNAKLYGKKTYSMPIEGVSYATRTVCEQCAKPAVESSTEAVTLPRPEVWITWGEGDSYPKSATDAYMDQLEQRIRGLEAKNANYKTAMISLGIAFDKQTDASGIGEHEWVHNARAEAAEAENAKLRAEGEWVSTYTVESRRFHTPEVWSVHAPNKLHPKPITDEKIAHAHAKKSLGFFHDHEVRIKRTDVRTVIYAPPVAEKKV